jgi:hypothetical protein
VGPDGQVAYLAYRLWPRTFVHCRNAGLGPCDNDTEVSRRGEHQPCHRFPVYQILGDDETSRRRLNGNIFEGEFKEIHVLGSHVEYGNMLVCR